MFGHDPQHSGRSSYTSPSSLQIKWTYSTGGKVRSSPAIGTDGTIYVGSYDGKLYAINPKGSLKWSYNTGSYISSSPAIGADGTIYVGSSDNKLYAVNPDGSLKWSYVMEDSIFYSPAIGADGTIYVGSYHNKLYAINPDGWVKWSYSFRCSVSSSAAIGADGTIYVSSYPNELNAVSPNGSFGSGCQIGPIISIASSPAIWADGTIYVGSDDGKLYAIGDVQAIPMPTATPTSESRFIGSLTVEWYKTFGGTGGERAECVQQTSDDGFIMVGYTDSYGAGEADVWLIKTDANGNKIWDRTFGGPGSEIGNFVQQTTDGGYVIVGSTSSFGAGCSDIWLIRTDAEGNKLWDKTSIDGGFGTFGGASCDYGYCVRQTSDGGLIVSGQNAADVWLIKTDSNGNKLWDRTYGAGVPYSIQETVDGGFIIIAGGRLIKIDSNGEQLWENKYEHSGGFSVQQTSDGGFIMTGVKSVESGGAYQYDALLLKTDAYGNVTWERVFGSPVGEDRGQSVQQTSDGGYIVGGITSSYGAGEYDVWVIRTDSDGNKLWDGTFGGSQADEVYSVQQTVDGAYILAGSTLSRGAGYNDVLLLKVRDPIPPKNMLIYAGGPALGFVFLVSISCAVIISIRRNRLEKRKMEEKKAEIIDMIREAIGRDKQSDKR
jgi:outer membrane protein assembly factor BamB